MIAILAERLKEDLPLEPLCPEPPGTIHCRPFRSLGVRDP